MLQFSRDPERGRCAWADRYRFRMELNWQRVKGEPDFDRMMKDYAGALSATWEDIEPVRHREWPGLAGKRDHEAVSRFGRYFSEIGLLVEIVFVNLDKRDVRLEREVLDTVCAAPPDGRGFQRWRAFGMDLRVPARFAPTEFVVEPARIGLRFDGPTRPDRWIFRRYGMVDSWMKTSLRDWLDRQADAFVRNRRTDTVTRGGIDIERMQGEWVPKGLLLARGAYASAAWRDPRDGRLYHAICITGGKHRGFHPAGGADETMTSCPEFSIVPKIEEATA